MPTNLRELIPVCGDKLNNSVPIRDATECRWTTTLLTPSGPLDCPSVQACMQSIIDAINIQITNNTNDIGAITTVVNNIGSVAHTHTNKPVLDIITITGSPLNYL